jgi:photosynthetic reaction center cytochrome c subunit
MRRTEVANSAFAILIILFAAFLVASVSLGVSSRVAAQSSAPNATAPQSAAPQSGAAQQSASKPTSSGAPSAQTRAKGGTAGESFENIQVLKDIREDQLIPSMRYITAALGVRCDFCHVQDQFPSDDKPEKGRAREMMKMLMAINTQNFHGHREVTCFTCHAGHSHPMNIPAIADASSVAAVAPTAAQGSRANAMQAGANGAAGESNGNASAGSPSFPSVDEILANYTKALGGDAIQKMTSRAEKGTVEIPARNVHSTMDVLRKAPDKAVATLHSPMGEVVEGFDGTTGWESRGRRGVEDETGDQLVRVREWASFIPGLDLKTEYSRALVNGIEQIGGSDAYRVVGFRNGGGAERLYFDKQSGLLVELDTRIDSPLGALPQQTDFQDYRDVNGVKIPFMIRVSRMDSATIYKWESVEANVPADDARFAKPAAPTPPPAKP